MRNTLTILMVVAALALPAMAQDKEGVSVTVYNGGYGVVRDIRTLDIGADGLTQFRDVAQQIDATTVHFKSFTDPAAKLLEQNYQFDLVNADKLLQKYIDKDLEIIAGGKGEKAEPTHYSGTLMSFDAGQLVLKEKEGNLVMIQRADNVRDIRFKALPEGLLTKPTLVWHVQTEKPGKQLAEVSYQTGGVNWHAEYVMVLDGDDATADLTGWVSVQNNSGKTYRDAKMKFIAGDVRGGGGQTNLGDLRMQAEGKRGGGMEEKAFFEYHMYTLPRPSTVADNEIKQLEMFTPVAGMKVEKKYLYTPTPQRWYGQVMQDAGYGLTSEKKVAVYIEFYNKESNKLGMPLPAGKIRLYKHDPADKALEFIGEQGIDHTAANEKLSLLVGNAFDVFGQRKQTDFKIEGGRKWMSESFEIKLTNNKTEAITVRVKEPLYRCQTWRIMESSVKGEKLDAFTEIWDLPVPAAKAKDQPGEVTLTYTVEYTW